MASSQQTPKPSNLPTTTRKPKAISEIVPEVIRSLQFRRQYDGSERARRFRTYNDEPSLTRQEFTEDADINVLVMRFGIDQEPPPPAVFDPRFYGDTEDMPDLRTALERMRDATQRFNDLPAKLRARFHNDPGELWAFVNDPENNEESVRLGLLSKYIPADHPEAAKLAGTTNAPPADSNPGEAGKAAPTAS